MGAGKKLLGLQPLPDSEPSSGKGDPHLAETMPGLSMVPPLPPREAFFDDTSVANGSDMQFDGGKSQPGKMPKVRISTPPPSPKDALESVADDELASFTSELRGLVQEIDQGSAGKSVEDVLRVGKEEFATQKQVEEAQRVDEEIEEMRRRARAECQEAKALVEKLKASGADADLVAKLQSRLDGVMAVFEDAKAGQAHGLGAAETGGAQSADEKFGKMRGRGKARKGASGEEVSEKKAVLESAVAMLQGEIETRKIQRLKDQISEEKIEQLIRGEIDEMSVFEEVDEEDEFGFRRVKLWGGYNFFNREKRLLCDLKKGEWFDEADVFKEREWKIPALKNAALSLVRQGEKSFFLANDGRKIPFSGELAKIYYSEPSEDAGWNDLKITQYDVIKPPDLSELYWDLFEQKVIALSGRYSDMPETAQAFDNLLERLRMVQGSLKPGWEAVLGQIKTSIEASSLEGGHKAHLLLELRKEAATATPKLTEEFQNSILPLPSFGKATWTQWGQWGKGVVLRITEGDKAYYNLVTSEGGCLYKAHFDRFDPFMDEIAKVKRGNKFNFIRKADGSLVSESSWFEEAGEPNQGMFRVKGADGKYNFVMISNGDPLSPVSFDAAEDFGKRGRARVRVGKEEYYIGLDGKRITSYSVEALKFVQGLFNILREKELPKEDKKKIILASIPERDARPGVPPRLGNALTGLFGLLLEAEKDRFLRGEGGNAQSIMGLFSKMRTALNSGMAEMEGAGKEAVSASLRGLRDEISAFVAVADVPTRTRLALREFVREMEGMRWQRVDPLQVPFLVSFGPLIRENPGEEKELLKLVRGLEPLAERYAYFVRGGTRGLSRDMVRKMRELSLDFELQVHRSRILPATRRAVLGVIREMLESKDLYWKDDTSLNQYAPRSQKGKLFHEMRTRPSAAPLVLPSVESSVPGSQSERCVRAVKAGNLATVWKAYGEYENLVRENPSYGFDHRKMGKELYAAIVRLQASDPSGVLELLDPAIRVFGWVLEKGGRDAESHYCLGALLEQKASVSRRPWIPGISKGYKSAVLAAEEYRMGLDSSPSEEVGKLLAERGREVSGVIRSSRIKAAFAAIGLALLGGGVSVGAYRLSADAPASAAQTRPEPVKSVEPVIESTEPEIRSVPPKRSPGKGAVPKPKTKRWNFNGDR